MRLAKWPAWLVAMALTVAAAQPWRNKDPKQWSKEEAAAVLTASPWAQSAPVTFPDTREAPPSSVYSLPGPAQAGMAGPQGATDGKWDGGVSRNVGGGLVPSLAVLVRWDSSLPVRQALLRQKELGSGQASKAGAEASLAAPASYVITVEGLLPARQYAPNTTLKPKSDSDSQDGTRPALTTEQVLEGIMQNTALLVRGAPTLHPENVKIDGPSGIIQVFFPRSVEITKSNKEVLFTTRFGSLNVEKRFRLNDMMYRGRLEL